MIPSHRCPALISACGSEVLLDTHGSIDDRDLPYQMTGGIFRGEIAAEQHAVPSRVSRGSTRDDPTRARGRPGDRPDRKRTASA